MFTKHFRKIAMAFMMVVAAVSLSGCYGIVPPAHKGKVLSASGFSPEVLEPGRHYVGPFQTLVLLETGTDTYQEHVDVILQDKMKLGVDISFRGRIMGSDKIINTMFNNVSNAGKTVTFRKVYNIYGHMAVQKATRDIISTYNVDDINTNYTAITAALDKRLKVLLASTPIEISDITIGSFEYPKTYTAAIEAEQKKRVEIKTMEAANQVALVKKKNELLLAEQDYNIEMKKAETTRDQNKVLAQGITPQLLELKKLEIQKIMAENAKNGSTIFMPYEALQSPGVSNRIFATKAK